MRNRTVKDMEFEWVGVDTPVGTEFHLDGNGPRYEGYFQCRGRIMFDDEHDEMPDPIVESAAELLADQLESIGIECQVEYSEKGWTEVHITNTEKYELRRN